MPKATPDDLLSLFLRGGIQCYCGSRVCTVGVLRQAFTQVFYIDWPVPVCNTDKDFRHSFASLWLPFDTSAHPTTGPSPLAAFVKGLVTRFTDQCFTIRLRETSLCHKFVTGGDGRWFGASIRITDRTFRDPNAFRAKAGSHKRSPTGDEYAFWAKRCKIAATSPATGTVGLCTHSVTQKHGAALALSDIQANVRWRGDSDALCAPVRCGKQACARETKPNCLYAKLDACGALSAIRALRKFMGAADWEAVTATMRVDWTGPTIGEVRVTTTASLRTPRKPRQRRRRPADDFGDL
jgi:hypothetical protein